MEENIAVAFANKYGIPVSNVSVTVERTIEKNETESLNSENIKSIHDPIFQQSLFQKWIDENGIEDYDMDELIKIDSQINSLIDYDSYEKGKKYTVKWIDWSNFLSYGKDNHFDFTQLHGLVLLNGIPGNKSGKSTFAYDLLHFLLFGKTKSGKSDDLSGLFNNYLPKETELYVKGCINIDGEDYIIKRILKRPAKPNKNGERKASQKVEYYRLTENGEEILLEDTENLEGASAKDTSAIIKESIGNENDFDLIISANAKDLDDLISLKKDARGKLLSRWIGLSVLEDKDTIARQKWNKEISVGRLSDIYNRETLKNEISELEEANKELEGLISANDVKIKSSDDKIYSYNEKKELLLSSKRQVDPSLTKIGDVTTLEMKLESTINEGKIKSELLKKIASELSEYDGIEEVDESAYKKLQSEKEGIISKQAELRSTYESLKRMNDNLASAEYCPTCKRKFEDVDNSSVIEENKEKMQNCINEGNLLKEKKISVEEKMLVIEQQRQKLREKNKLELKQSAENTEILKLRSQAIELKNLIKQLNDNHDNIKHNCSVDAQVNAVNESIKIEEKIVNNLVAENTQYNNTIGRNLENISRNNGYIAKIDEEQKIEKNWKLYLKLIGKDGICKIVLKNTLPIINSELNNLLGDTSDFKVEVNINDNNDVDFWMIRDGIYTRLSGASGLERTQAALALRVVLGNMSRLSKPPFILLDEILGTTDKEFYDDMKKLYDKIVKHYNFIIHICHIDLGWEDMIVTVKKENNISRIESIH